METVMPIRRRMFVPALLLMALALWVSGCRTAATGAGPAQAPPRAVSPEALAAFHQDVGAGALKKVREQAQANPALVNAADANGGTALHAAVYDGRDDVAQFLVASGADVNAKKKDGWTALHFAVWRGNRAMTELLLAKGANVNARRADGGTPLHAAVMDGHSEIVVLLVSKGADVNARKDDGWTPLRFALWRGYPEIAGFLRRHGAREITRPPR